ncbi:hypothetical protein HZS_4614 [Henneguya salminicola]|nr:hypothetical protein HZS_4614 [Henneguya salminicola]
MIAVNQSHLVLLSLRPSKFNNKSSSSFQLSDDCFKNLVELVDQKKDNKNFDSVKNEAISNLLELYEEAKMQQKVMVYCFIIYQDSILKQKPENNKIIVKDLLDMAYRFACSSSVEAPTNMSQSFNNLLI